MNRLELSLLLVLAAVGPQVACGSKDTSTDKSKSTESDEDDDDDGSKKKKKKKSDKDNDKDKDEPAKSADPVAAPLPTETPPIATAPADTPPVTTGVAPSPTGRSAVPTLDEWSKVGEVTVLGSDKLDCETKMVREWIRVTCKGNAPERGTPTGVSITRGGGKGDTFTFASGGVASLIYPFYESQNLEASFAWQKMRRSFKAEWPRGAPKPTAYGIFEGGDAHLKK